MICPIAFLMAMKTKPAQKPNPLMTAFKFNIAIQNSYHSYNPDRTKKNLG